VPPEVEEPFDPVPILEAFAREGVDFVVIGGVAGGAYGSSYGTFDVDLAYGRERANLERVTAVLRSLGATLRDASPDLPFQLDPRTLAEGENFTFSTRLGSVDLLAHLPGAPPYERLRDEATLIEIRGQSIRVASLDHLIAMKEAAGRPKDLLMASEYRELAEERGQAN
jgi:hypothetical protein